MAKRCSCVIYGPPGNPPDICTGCLNYPDLMILMEDSVTADGQNGSADLLEKKPSAYQDDDLIFTLSSHGKGVEDVIITDNILSFTTVPELPINEYAKVNIKVKRISTGDSKFFTVNVGMKNLCVTVNCAACNPTTGDCLTAETASITTTCSASASRDIKLGSVLSGCTGGTLTYKIISFPSSITNAVISINGMLTYSVSSAPIFGIPLPIKYEISCSLWGLKSVGTLNITIPNLCVGVEWDDILEECNQCTGVVTDREADLSIEKAGVGFKNSNGVGFN